MYSCFMGLQVMVRRCKGMEEARHKCGSPPDDIRGAGLGDQASRRGACWAGTRQDLVGSRRTRVTSFSHPRRGDFPSFPSVSPT